MKIKRTLLMVLGGLLALLVAGIAGGGWWLGSQVSKEGLVARIESEWNCRAHLDDTSVSLLSSPAGIRLKGLRLAPRDAEAGKPLAQRAPLDPAAIRIAVDEAVLEITLGDMLARKISVQRLTFAGINVREDIDKDGQSAMAELFRKPPRETAQTPASAPQSAPGTVADAAQPPPPAEPAKPPSKAKTGGASTSSRKHSGGFKAESLGFSLEVKEAGLKRASLNLLNRKAKTRTLISDLNFALTEIDLDPAELAAHNRCKLAMDGRLEIQGGFKVGKEIRRGELVRLDLAGQGDVRPLDPATGVWSPRVEWDMLVKKESVILGNMTLGEVEADGLKRLKGFGLDLSAISMGGPLQQDARIHITFDKGRIEFLEDAVFSLPDYELVATKGGWANADEDDHEMGLRLVFGTRLQDTFKQSILKTGLVDEGTVDGFFKTFSDERGRFYLDIESKGPLSKPKPKIPTQKLLDRILKGGGINNLLKDLLK